MCPALCQVLGHSSEQTNKSLLSLKKTKTDITRRHILKAIFDGDEYDEENSAECDRVTEQAKLDQERSLGGGDI